jgi:hypothetical protein
MANSGLESRDFLDLVEEKESVGRGVEFGGGLGKDLEILGAEFRDAQVRKIEKGRSVSRKPDLAANLKEPEGLSRATRTDYG